VLHTETLPIKTVVGDYKFGPKIRAHKCRIKIYEAAGTTSAIQIRRLQIEHD